MGDSKVGKTTILNTLMEDEDISNVHKVTVGVKCRQKKIPIILSNNEELINVIFWDTAGVYYFKALTESHYRRAHAGIVVFDVEKSQTYEDALGLIEEFKTFKQPDAICILLANKCESSDYDVDLSVVEEYCKLHHIMFKKVSALASEEELRTYFEDILHGKVIISTLEICNNNYTNMLLEREEVVTQIKSHCGLI